MGVLVYTSTESVFPLYGTRQVYVSFCDIVIPICVVSLSLSLCVHPDFERERESGRPPLLREMMISFDWKGFLVGL